MNLLKNPTIEELQTLLSACDDNECHHVVWVTHNAEVKITPFGDNFWQETENILKYNFAPYMCGNGYVGIAASQDMTWVKSLFNDLLTSWPDCY